MRTILVHSIILFTVVILSCESSPKREVSQAEIDSAINERINSARQRQSNRPKKDPYEMMEVAFEGYPDREEIKPMLEEVMKRYGLDITEDNLSRAGSVLVTLRKESKVGVTELEILKHMYQRGAVNSTFPNQAAVSSLILERTK